MIRDIFDTDASTLDIIIYAALTMLDLERWQLTGVYGSTPDERAAYNAEQFAEHFAGHPIQAIKAIRQVSGLGLKDSKDAWDQLLETYELTRSFHLRAAKRAADRFDVVAVQYHLGKLD